MAASEPAPADDEVAYDQALDKALKLLARRARSKRELRALLKRMGFADAVVSRVESRLVEVEVLDDASFAYAATEYYGRNRGESRRAIRSRLAAEQVPEAVIAEAISELLGEESDLDRALVLATRRARRYGRLDPNAAAGRLARYLAQRGYDFEIVEEVCRRVFRLTEVE